MHPTPDVRPAAAQAGRHAQGAQRGEGERHEVQVQPRGQVDDARLTRPLAGMPAACVASSLY